MSDGRRSLISAFSEGPPICWKGFLSHRSCRFGAIFGKRIGPSDPGVCAGERGLLETRV
jgi:hypothetical protein